MIHVGTEIGMNRVGGSPGVGRIRVRSSVPRPNLWCIREVAIRKCMRRAAEHPDDVPHPVRRACAQRTELFSATIYIGSINILPGK